MMMCSAIFTALLRMQTRSRDENSVCLSLCLSKACAVIMTLSGVIAFILHFLTEFDCFAGQLRHRRTCCIACIQCIAQWTNSLC